VHSRGNDAGGILGDQVVQSEVLEGLAMAKNHRKWFVAFATRYLGDDPIEALSAEVSAVDGREAIILTRSHVVSEFFHLDWTSRARRKIGVPVLHLLEHENFDEQAGSGEGVTGL